jgi:hypothetical protein
MREIRDLLRLVLLLIFASLFIASCGNGHSNKLGTPISHRHATPIAEVFDFPDRYDGETLTLKGVIDMQDRRGYWFYMEDDEARIYVDLFDSGFAIPQLTGRRVLAEGKIEVKVGVPSLLAKSVETL